MDQAEAADRAARAYSAAADHYDRPALGFWDRWGEATVSRLALTPGQKVLDLCCGAGGSAIPAARAVGPEGQVLAVDLAVPLLELGRAKAAGERLANIEFRAGDATSSGLPGESFDAVACVFGVFFAKNVPAFVAEMWRLARPGGTLAVTTWGQGWCEPASTVFWESVRDVDTALFRGFNPWDEITTPDKLEGLFTRAGIDGARADAVSGEQVLERPEDFWDVVLGSGFRATVDALQPEQRDLVHDRVVSTLRSRDIRTLQVDVVFGTATKPSG